MGHGRQSAVAIVAALIAIAVAVGPVADRVALGVRVARADDAASTGAVALLPLDADERLELYGQPVASEVARALVAGGIEVVVVGPKMAVPPRARLIVDGTIAVGKGDAVILALRVRDPRTGKVVGDNLTATASTLANIDRAAAELSARVLPVVRTELGVLAAADRAASASATPATLRPATPITPVAPAAPTTKLYVLASGGVASPMLQTALADAATRWSRRVGREPARATPDALAPVQVVGTIAAHHADVGIAFDVRAFELTAGAVPIARATVRVRIADSTGVLFDRVVVTDSVVGERGMTEAALIARTADAVVEIAAPHVRRVVAAWAAR